MEQNKYVKPFDPARLALDKPRSPDKSGAYANVLEGSNVLAFPQNLTRSTSRSVGKEIDLYHPRIIMPLARVVAEANGAVRMWR